MGQFVQILGGHLSHVPVHVQLHGLDHIGPAGDRNRDLVNKHLRGWTKSSRVVFSAAGPGEFVEHVEQLHGLELLLLLGHPLHGVGLLLLYDPRDRVDSGKTADQRRDLS